MLIEQAPFSILDFYAPNAAVECGCSALKVRHGRAAITEYWIERFAEKPAGELVEFQPAGGGIAVAYKVDVDEFVRATLYFDHEGKIARSVCGPATPRGNSAYSMSITAIKLPRTLSVPLPSNVWLRTNRIRNLKTLCCGRLLSIES